MSRLSRLFHRPGLLVATVMLAPHLPPPTLAASAERIEEMVVTGTGRATRPIDVPASVSMVARGDFERRADRFIGEELRGLPGVLVGTGDQGTYTGLTIRGVPNRIHNDTLVVLLDGVPIVTADDEVDLEQVPFHAVGQVDLVRGPGSALYGRGAIAGTVNYRTREVGDEYAAEAAATVGTFGWRRGTALVQVPTFANSALLLSGEVQRADGFRDRTGRQEESLFLKHRTDLADWGRFDLTASWVDQDQDLAGQLPVDAVGEPIPLPRGRRSNFNEDDAGFDKRIGMTTGTLETNLAEGLTATTRLHARQVKTSARQGFFIPFVPTGDAAADRIGFTGFQVDGDNDTLFGEGQVDWSRGPVRLLAGASAERIRANHIETWTGELGEDPGTGEFLFFAQRRLVATGGQVNRDAWVSERLLDARSRQRTVAAYVHGDLELGRATLSAGGRFDRFARTVDYGPSSDGFAPLPEVTVADADSRISPTASLSWRLAADATAYVAYGAGFSPGFGPLWSFRNRDTDLAPELADNVEAGVKGELPGGGLQGSLTLYRLTRRDLLQLLPVGGTAATINTGRQRSRGIELELLADLGAAIPGLSMGLTYGFTDSIWVENAFLEPFTGRPFDFSGRDVAGVPRHAGRLTITQAFADLGLAGQIWIDAAGDYPFDAANTVRGGGAALWNAALSWTPPALPWLEATATVRNLFDRAVDTVVSDNDGPLARFPQPPREAFLTLRGRF